MNKKEKLAVIILGAGKGKRMKSKKAKVLHLLAGRPMIEYTTDLALSLGVKKTVLIVGHQGEDLIHLFALAMRHGISAGELKQSIFAFPTFSSDAKNLL